MALSKFIIIRTYLPVIKELPGAVTFDDLVQACPSLSSALDLIERSDPIGVMGNYKSVFEIQLGFEGFIPDIGANPTKGQLDKRETIKSVALTTYAAADCKAEVVNDFVQELAEVHPWEHPVIEVVRGPGIQVWATAKTKSGRKRQR